jgi:hypothetical protein
MGTIEWFKYFLGAVYEGEPPFLLGSADAFRLNATVPRVHVARSAGVGAGSPAQTARCRNNGRREYCWRYFPACWSPASCAAMSWSRSSGVWLLVSWPDFIPVAGDVCDRARGSLPRRARGRPPWL